MKSLGNFIKLFALLLVAPFATAMATDGPGSEPAETVLHIAVRFYLVTDMLMTKQGVEMTNWISPEMISKTVMPEVNRIWSSAKIEWTLLGVSSATTQSKNRAEVINYVLNAGRDKEGGGDPERIIKLLSIINLKKQEPKVVDLYVIPYLGSTSQGNTSPKQERVLLGQWTDKPSGGRLPPEKCLLVEGGDFKQGSFSRTVAHELGHILGLNHPPKNKPPFNRLMGGSKQGYELTVGERTIARSSASALTARSTP
jgi:hypothetical protein